jgi:hypothetical protein
MLYMYKHMRLWIIIASFPGSTPQILLHSVIKAGEWSLGTRLEHHSNGLCIKLQGFTETITYLW